MVVHVKLGSVRWIKADRVARRPRRKRMRWLLAGLATESGPPRIAAVRTTPAPRPECARTARRIPHLKRSKFIWLNG